MAWYQRHTPILRANQWGLWAEGTLTKKKRDSLTVNGYLDASCHCFLGSLSICFCYSEGGLSLFCKFPSIIPGTSMDIPLLSFKLSVDQCLGKHVLGLLVGSGDKAWPSFKKHYLGHLVSVRTEKQGRLVCLVSLICNCSQKLRINRD